MGTKVGPSVADIFMSFIDEDIKRKAMNFAINMTNPLSFFKRFLDDILMLWTDSYENLHKFLKEINTIHPSIKFTMEHTKKIADPTCSSSASSPPPPPRTQNSSVTVNQPPASHFLTRVSVSETDELTLLYTGRNVQKTSIYFLAAVTQIQSLPTYLTRWPSAWSVCTQTLENEMRVWRSCATCWWPAATSGS